MRRYNPDHATSQRVRKEYRVMNYTKAFGELTDKAQSQGATKIEYRTKVSLHANYAVYLHGTYRWVRRRDWNKQHVLDPAQYADVRDESDEAHTVALPVCGTPVLLRLYRTDIVIFHANGNVELHAGGWEGPTTAKWMNTATHVHVGPHKPGAWDPSVWCLRDCYGQLTRFYDGLTLNREGRIISKVKPVIKHGVDRDKMRPWREAVRHLRTLAWPFLTMLEGSTIPRVLLDEVRAKENSDTATYVFSRPAEFDPAIVVFLATTYSQRWVSPNATLHNVLPRFNASLQRAAKEWTKKHALKKV